jgi:hypothetical protein
VRGDIILRKIFERYGDDILLVVGCGCILVGMAMVNIPLTWMAGGLMLILFGILIGKAKAKNVIN